jgi:hypothetical protein
LPFLAQWIATGAEAVAEIVKQQAGLDCVQIDQADHSFFIPRKEKITNLGIAVNGLFGDLPYLPGIFE